jgi:outer membrane receptor protein involved in Fe transport
LDSTDGALGHGLRAAVNVPVSDSLALRASGFTRRDPGYVENLTTGQQDVNQVDVRGGRVSALWRPSTKVSLKLAAMLQNTEGKGSAEVDTQLGNLQQARMPGTEGYSQKTALYSGVLNASLASLDLTSISAYGTYKYSHLSDQTALYGGYAQDLFGVAGASLLDSIEAKKFSQEVRLTSPTGRKYEWLLGAFYMHEKTPAHQSLLANDPATGAVIGSQVEIDFPTSYTEQALFADLTVHFTDQFDIQIGGRTSTNRQVYDELDDGPLYGGISVTPTSHVKGQANTYLFTPQFKFSPDLMAYARFTSGYRAGGPNAYVPGNSALPKKYDADKDYSYDVGMKGELFDRKLSFDVAAYRINWKDVQIAVIDPDSGFLIHTNGGTAKSQGLELAIKSRPSSHLTIAASITLDDAALSEDLPEISSAIGLAGDRLPFSSRFAGSLSADQEFPLGGAWTGSVGGTLRYVGDRKSDFVAKPFPPTDPPAIRAALPNYAQLDLRASAHANKWDIGLFINNVSDTRGFVGRTLGGTSTAVPTAVYIQPRSFGVSVSKEF